VSGVETRRQRPRELGGGARMRAEWVSGVGEHGKVRRRVLGINIPSMAFHATTKFARLDPCSYLVVAFHL
jgi:hypothetical protein